MPLVPLHRHSIAHATEDALSRLSTTLEEAQSYTTDEELSLALRRYSDEIERLEIWAHEHDVKSGGLDHRLRDASVLRNRVLSLLAQLSGTAEAKSCLDGDEESFKEAGLESLVASTPVHLLGGDDDDKTSLSLDTECTLPDSLSDSPLTHIHDLVNSLLGLGPTLLDPAPRDRLEWSAHKDAAHYDIDHVRARFPGADEYLFERLGRANWERRQNLIQLRSKLDEGNHGAPGLDAARPIDAHLERLTIGSLTSDSGIDSSEDNASDMGEASTVLTQSYRSDLKKGLSTQGPLTVTTSNAPSEFQFSANDLESTALTEPSNSILQVGPTGSRYAVPSPPHPNERFSGEEFLCPFCAHRASDMKSPADWK